MLYRVLGLAWKIGFQEHEPAAVRIAGCGDGKELGLDAEMKMQ